MQKTGLSSLALLLVLLILFLTFMGILLRNQNANAIYPPNNYQCPDYWTADSSGNCYIPTVPSFANSLTILNMGGQTTLSSTAAPYSTDGVSFSTTNPLWANGGQSTVCSQKRWSNNSGIEWSGISNYNQC